jgi:two-component system response regulator AlgR
MSLRVLIVDDEPSARTRLRDLLAAFDDVVVVGDVDNGPAAIDACRDGAVDLVLLDIRMPGIDGLATARQLADHARPPAVVFLTAFDDRAIDAFDTGAIDYLLKPVRAERLAQALARVHRVAPEAAAAGDAPRRHFIVRRGLQILRVPVDHALCLRAEDKYVRVITHDANHLIEDSLTAIEREFGDRFLRIHRNCLIAADRIRGLLRDANGSERVHVDGLTDMPEVSRRNLAAVRARLIGNA